MQCGGLVHSRKKIRYNCSLVVVAAIAHLKIDLGERERKRERNEKHNIIIMKPVYLRRHEPTQSRNPPFFFQFIEC